MDSAQSSQCSSSAGPCRATVFVAALLWAALAVEAAAHEGQADRVEIQMAAAGLLAKDGAASAVVAIGAGGDARGVAAPSGNSPTARTDVSLLGPYYCWGVAYTGGHPHDGLYAIYQRSPTGEWPVYVYYSKYAPGGGWVQTDRPICWRMPNCAHPFFGYWGDEYHVGWVDQDTSDQIKMVDSATWEGFYEIDALTECYDLVPMLTWPFPFPAAYAFDNDRAWVMHCGRYLEDYVIEYWSWSADSGWSWRQRILTTMSASILATPAILQLDQDSWRMYYMHDYGGERAAVRFVETQDAGQTWSVPQECLGLQTHTAYSRIAFARYGDNYFLFLVSPDMACVCYESTDGIAWSNPQVLLADSPVGYYMHHGCLLDQSHLLSTASDQYRPTGIGDQYGIIHEVRELWSHPTPPTEPGPADGVLLPPGTESVTLSVTVGGPRTYDIAMYWADDTFLGESRALRDGQIAAVEVTGLEDGRTYHWYAIARGTTGCYWGGTPVSRTDEQRSATWRFTVADEDSAAGIPDRARPSLAGQLRIVPNPVTSTTLIRFTLPDPAQLAIASGHPRPVVPLRVEIFDVNGQLVRALAHCLGWGETGSLPWDGLDEQGRRAAPGCYACRLSGAGLAAASRIVLLR